MSFFHLGVYLLKSNIMFLIVLSSLCEQFSKQYLKMVNICSINVVKHAYNTANYRRCYSFSVAPKSREI